MMMEAPSMFTQEVMTMYNVPAPVPGRLSDPTELPSAPLSGGAAAFASVPGLAVCPAYDLDDSSFDPWMTSIRRKASGHHDALPGGIILHPGP